MAVKKSEYERWVEMNPLRKWRTEYEKPIAEVAVRCGKSLVAVRNWETGLNMPTDENMELLKDLTKIRKLEDEWSSWYSSRPRA